MDLKDFVTEALRQVVEGVSAAQPYAENVGGYINPGDVHINKRPEGVRYVQIPGMGVTFHEICVVEFDVAVTVSESSDKKGGLGVVAAVVTAGGALSSAESTQSVTRVKFGVPVAFPQHPDTNPQFKELRQKREQRRRAAKGPATPAAPAQP